MSVDITSLVISVKSDGIKEASNSLSGLSTSANNAEKRVSALTSAMTRLNDVNKLSTTAADAFMVKLREQATLMQSLSNNSRTAANGTQALAAAMALLSSSLNILVQQQTRAESTQRLHNNAMRESHALARGLAGSLGALWVTYGNFAGMAVGVAIGTALKGIVTVGKDVEHTLEGIRVRGNETVESVNNIRNSVMELGKGIYGPQQVASAFETLVLAGLKAEQALSSIGAALNLATVGGVSIEKAATTLVSVGTAVGFAAEGFGRVGDVIAKTAALSMSSVETLSEAFKSASSVNRLYGVSLEDIGTSLGVLSNLGIKGSAAGTALKNFYKELAAESDKVSGTFKDMGISQAMLKDASGNFKPLLEVVQILDTSFKKLSESEAKLAQGRTSNERGQRLMTQLLGEFNTKTEDGSNALEKFRQNVENSYGFAARGAAQMALTAKSQIDSMFNTLKTSFAETFQSVEPEIIGFSARMKQIFGSREFKDGIVALAQSFASLAITVAENVPLLTKLAGAFILLKAGMAVIPMLQALPAIVTAISTAYYAVISATTALAAGTLTLTAAFPPLLIMLGLATVAITTYNMLKGGDDARVNAKNAEAYSQGYIDGLIKESENLDKINSKLREKKSLQEISAEMERDESRQKMVDLDNRAIKEAEANFEKTKGNFDINASLSAMNALNKARETAANHLKLAGAAESTLFEKAKLNAQLAKQNADERRKQEVDSPTARLSGKIDSAGANDVYATHLTTIRGEIEAGKRELQNIEAAANSRFKAGLISEFDQIDAISDARIKKLTNDVSKFQAMIDTAAPKNRGNVSALVKNEMTAAQDKLSEEKNRREEAYSVVYAKMQEENYNNHYKQLTLQGRNEEAAVEKSKKLYESKLENEKVTLLESLQELSVASGPQVEELQRKVAALMQHISYMQSETDALIGKGKLDDSELATQKLMDKFRIKVAEINANVKNGGLTAGIMADEEIERLRAQQIPEMEKLLAVQKALAEAPNAGPDAIKTLAKTQETLVEMKKKVGGTSAWEGAQKSLRDYAKEASDDGALIGGVMSNAFKSAEDALVNFVMTGKLNFKSFANSVIADLVRIQTKQMLSGMFGMGGKGGSGGMGMMGSFGSMAAGAQGLMEGYGSFAMMNAGVAASQGLSIADLAGAFADGGDPPVGQVSLVGERGPELFVPKTAGTIIPNHMLNASSPTQQASSSSNDRPMQYTIVNQTTGRIDSVKEQRLSDDERALIISEAVNATASSLYDTNSRMSKGMRNTHDVQRKR